MFLFGKIYNLLTKSYSFCPLFQDQSGFSLSRKRNFQFHLVPHELLCVWVFCSAKASITNTFCESSCCPGCDICVLYHNVQSLNHWITSNPVTFCSWTVKATKAVDILAQSHSVPLKFLPGCSLCFPEWWGWFKHVWLGFFFVFYWKRKEAGKGSILVLSTEGALLAPAIFSL